MTRIESRWLESIETYKEAPKGSRLKRRFEMERACFDALKAGLARLKKAEHPSRPASKGRA